MIDEQSSARAGLHLAPAVTMASYGGVSTSTSLERPIPSLGIGQNIQASAPTGNTSHSTATAAVGCDGPLSGLSGGAVGASSDQAHLTRFG